MTLDELPRAFWLFWIGALGLVVGSFLNVCIHRLPREGQSVARPRRSRCPRCGRELGWRENLPVLSWLLQRGRCLGCRGPISWRYPLVELLTAALWLAAAWGWPAKPWPVVAVQILVLSGLVVATFVDFEFFEIPDEVSIGGLVLAPVASWLVPELHAATWVARWASDAPAGGVDRFGAVVGALSGMAVGAGVLLAVGWFGKRAYGRDAMGLGDVKLLGAAGGFIGPGGVLVALIVASCVASVAGLGNILRFFLVVRARDRARGRRRGPGPALRTARVAGRYVPFGPYLALGIGIALLYWNDVRGWLGWP